MVRLFKGIRDTFENFEWNFRDTKAHVFWGYLFKMLYDFRDTVPNIFRDTGYWGPPSRVSSLLFKKLQFYLSWPVEFSTKFLWSHALASDCVNGKTATDLSSGSFHTEVLQNIMYLRFRLDMLHVSIKIKFKQQINLEEWKTHLWTRQLNFSKELFRHTTTRKQLLTGLTANELGFSGLYIIL